MASYSIADVGQVAPGGPDGTARGTKATSDLEWSTSAAGSFSSLSTTAATAATGNAGGNFFTSFYLRSRICWQLDKPDQYSLTMMFTLTAP